MKARRLLTSYHSVSRRSLHSRPTVPLDSAISAGQSDMTRIFRNEEVAGSNPASSTETPGQSVCRKSETLAVVPSCLPMRHRRATGLVA